ncbi:hypothetical protein G6W43_10055 [Campylobacter concisus]|uniref:hypothetical protein n=1 Tax=Campylobacter concisus TaxID=199 RepID=UPI0011E845F0|nr:hypothetical protein [Campylobacter concisus]MBE9857563.1 hypothetical protein [Campylobacter concisus]
MPIRPRANLSDHWLYAPIEPFLSMQTASKQWASISHDYDRHNCLNISYMGWAAERIFLPLLRTSVPKP